MPRILGTFLVIGTFCSILFSGVANATPAHPASYCGSLSSPSQEMTCKDAKSRYSFRIDYDVVNDYHINGCDTTRKGIVNIFDCHKNNKVALVLDYQNLSNSVYYSKGSSYLIYNGAEYDL
jgi:hypothetical protein